MTKKHQSGSVSYIFANYTTLTVKANSKMQTKRINIRQSNKRLFDHLILQSCQVYLYFYYFILFCTYMFVCVWRVEMDCLIVNTKVKRHHWWDNCNLFFYKLIFSSLSFSLFLSLSLSLSLSVTLTLSLAHTHTHFFCKPKWSLISWPVVSYSFCILFFSFLCL